jgi:hypothetical protein
MLYVVEMRRQREQLARVMSEVREWLDRQRFEPDAFRCATDEEGITCRLEFKNESEALACVEAFGGRLASIGDKSAG